MTNGDSIRKMGDTELMHFITRNFKMNNICKYCDVGIDSKNRCNDPSIDCEKGVFDYLGRENKNS